MYPSQNWPEIWAFYLEKLCKSTGKTKPFDRVKWFIYGTLDFNLIKGFLFFRQTSDSSSSQAHKNGIANKWVYDNEGSSIGAWNLSRSDSQSKHNQYIIDMAWVYTYKIKTDLKEANSFAYASHLMLPNSSKRCSNFFIDHCYTSVLIFPVNTWSHRIARIRLTIGCKSFCFSEYWSFNEFSTCNIVQGKYICYATYSSRCYGKNIAAAKFKTAMEAYTSSLYIVVELSVFHRVVRPRYLQKHGYVFQQLWSFFKVLLKGKEDLQAVKDCAIWKWFKIKWTWNAFEKKMNHSEGLPFKERKVFVGRNLEKLWSLFDKVIPYKRHHLLSKSVLRLMDYQNDQKSVFAVENFYLLHIKSYEGLSKSTFSYSSSTKELIATSS